MTRIAVVAGALLGVLSRVEETTDGLSLGVSANATWLGVAFAAGVLQRQAPPLRGAAAGALALATANLAYYAWIAATEPGVALASVAGSPLSWLALGIGGGAVFGAAGRVWTQAVGITRVLAGLPLAGVCIAEGIPAVLGGPATDGVALVVGAALPVASGRGTRERALGAALSAGVIAVALSGRLESLMP
ncbi:MAG: DUF6518 family protein [Solirubrobacteraceae bacterium]|nr:DUF6518 family protein [Solirubrobacteraceae bacterium]